jgi:DNA gyrase/topoisomerase IV subunit A
MDGEFDELSALRQRVRLLDALLDALERMDEINQAVRKSQNRIEARHILMGEPFGYTETVARHILDLSVGRQTINGIEELRREREQASERLQKLE